MTSSAGPSPDIQALLAQDAETFYDEAPTGYATILPSGEIVRANLTLANWLGNVRDELIGRRIQSLFTVGGQVYYETHCAPLLAMQGFLREIAIDLKAGDGSVRPVLIAARAQHAPDGAVRIVRVAVFDASERRRYETELLAERKRAEENLRVKSELIRMLSHDVRAPLSTIQNIALLLHKAATPETRQRQLEILQRASAGIVALVDQILEYERTDKHLMPLQTEPVDLRQHLSATVEQFETEAANKTIALTLRIDPQVPEQINADPVKLGQILRNLIGNAIKFTAKGTVWVSAGMTSATSGGTRLELTVQDSGIGIDPDRLSVIFEAFRQADPCIRRDYGGSGLGLSICKRLVELHDGELRVESEPGVGSRFVVTLPID